MIFRPRPRPTPAPAPTLEDLTARIIASTQTQLDKG